MDSSVKSLIPDKASKERSKQCCSKNFIFLLVVVFCFLSTLVYIVFPDPFEFKAGAFLLQSTPPDAIRISETLKTSPTQHSTIENRPKYTFADLDKFLCAKQSEPPNNTRTVLKKPCPTRGIITAIAGGRTGNQMWEYASIWALGKKLGLEPFVPTCIKWKLEVMFDNLLLPTFRAIAHCPFDFNSSVSTVGNGNNEKSIILPRFNFRFSDAMPWMEQILKEFNFRKELKDKAQQTLHELLPKSSTLKYTFIAVHVRRTDYIKYVQRSLAILDCRLTTKRFNQRPVTDNFFRKAMAYYRERFFNCAFIYISDDPNWCFNQFGNITDVYVASYHRYSSMEEDLALMEACNHSIIDYGTFGEWGSFLAGGHTVASNTQVINEATRKWGHWTLIDDVNTL
ncbi:hypothetical protein HUJ04_006249 [Dendroctonus ponderosae]|nr:hypothetical protein HUJ04_006249 [Dendroctonus ponderosae]